jgi:hypothetical protein
MSKNGPVIIIGGLLALLWALTRKSPAQAAPVAVPTVSGHPKFQVGDVLTTKVDNGTLLQVTGYSPTPAPSYGKYTLQFIAIGPGTTGAVVGKTSTFNVSMADNFFIKSNVGYMEFPHPVTPVEQPYVYPHPVALGSVALLDAIAEGGAPNADVDPYLHPTAATIAAVRARYQANPNAVIMGYFLGPGAGLQPLYALSWLLSQDPNAWRGLIPPPPLTSWDQYFAPSGG